MARSFQILTMLFLFLCCNSVLNAQNNEIVIHDPVITQANGKYYLFSTGVGIASWESDDMTHWQLMPQIFAESPAWAKQRVPKFDGNIWAPDIFHHNSTYYLYYSISSFASNRSCIGVLTNKTLDRNSADFKWIDHGVVVESYPGRDCWNAIDPNIIIDEEGKPWMSFGSFWGGIQMVQLSSNLLSIAEPQAWHHIATRPRSLELDPTDPGDGAIEAPFIFKKGDYFYLFVSFDLCCRGSNSTYNVRVGRSLSAVGPYVDQAGVLLNQGGGTLIMDGGEKWYGVGHNAVATINGEDYTVMHGYEKSDHGKPKLIVRKIKWSEDGWPKIIAE